MGVRASPGSEIALTTYDDKAPLDDRAVTVLPLRGEDAVQEDQGEEKEKEMHHFFSLPAELRQLIYAELLFTNSAFRLGHHGPYTHENPHKPLHTSILRTCSQIHAEAAPVLYGHNSFFLGPIGHKPTYSASFLDSIGRANALLIRTLVCHSIYPQLLTRRYVESWLWSLGLDVSRVKVLAVSFGEGRTRDIIGGNAAAVLGSNVGPGPPQMGTPPALIPAGGTHSVPTAAMHQHQHSNLVPMTGHLGNMAALQLGVLNGTTQTATTVINGGAGGSTPNPTLSALDKERTLANEYEDAVKKTKGWLEPIKRRELAQLICLKNTDLRAGNDWLVYISPGEKRKKNVFERLEID